MFDHRTIISILIFFGILASSQSQIPQMSEFNGYSDYIESPPSINTNVDLVGSPIPDVSSAVVPPTAPAVAESNYTHQDHDHHHHSNPPSTSSQHSNRYPSSGSGNYAHLHEGHHQEVSGGGGNHKKNSQDSRSAAAGGGGSSTKSVGSGGSSSGNLGSAKTSQKIVLAAPSVTYLQENPTDIHSHHQHHEDVHHHDHHPHHNYGQQQEMRSYYDYDQHYAAQPMHEMAYRSEFYWLIPLMMIIGIGALLLPLCSVFMTALVSNGAISLSGMTGKRRRRRRKRETSIKDSPEAKSDDIFNSLINDVMNENQLKDSILNLLTKVESAVESFSRNHYDDFEL